MSTFFWLYVHLLEYMSTLWKKNVQKLEYLSIFWNICPHFEKKCLTIGAYVHILGTWIPGIIYVWNVVGIWHEGGYIQKNLCHNAISYSRFGQTKCIIFQYSVHVSWFCPLFWHCVDIFRFMSTFSNICPNFRIYVHIPEYISTFSSTCPHLWKYVYFMKYMLFFHYYPMFMFWY